MKKIYLIALFTTILFSNSCSDSKINSAPTETKTTIDVTVETFEEQKNESTIDENMVSTESIEKFDTPIELPNTEGLTQVLAETFVSVGLDTVPQLEFKNYENSSGMINIDVYAETEKCNLLFDCSYIDIIDSWSVSFVKNSDNQHIYWVTKGLESKVDLYDYNTDTLISAKTETFSSDPAGDFESQAESISDDFEKSLESIADNYQIETKQD